MGDIRGNIPYSDNALRRLVNQAPNDKSQEKPDEKYPQSPKWQPAHRQASRGQKAGSAPARQTDAAKKDEFRTLGTASRNPGEGVTVEKQEQAGKPGRLSGLGSRISEKMATFVCRAKEFLSSFARAESSKKKNVPVDERQAKPKSEKEIARQRFEAAPTAANFYVMAVADTSDKGMIAKLKKSDEDAELLLSYMRATEELKGKNPADPTSLNTYRRGQDASTPLIKSAVADYSKAAAKDLADYAKLRLEEEGASSIGIGVAAYGARRSKDDETVDDFASALYKQFRDFGKAPTDEKVISDARDRMMKFTVDVVDGAAKYLFGDPDSPESIEAAAAKIPVEVCTLLAGDWKAVDDHGAGSEEAFSDDVKQQLKLNAARNLLALRSVNPELTNTVAALRGKAGESHENLMQMAKALQSLTNGVGLGAGGKDLYAGLAEEDARMKDRWSDGFLKFAKAVVARADLDSLDRVAAKKAEFFAQVEEAGKAVKERVV